MSLIQGMESLAPRFPLQLSEIADQSLAIQVHNFSMAEDMRQTFWDSDVETECSHHFSFSRRCKTTDGRACTPLIPRRYLPLTKYPSMVGTIMHQNSIIIIECVAIDLLELFGRLD